ncbi:MAG: TIGR03960 family B12-binding radical SAM protein [Anaerolineales bacterium]|nr:TIGR03960 family B12-binding radical SAM protein [Anaerolineales bacterium]
MPVDLKKLERILPTVRKPGRYVGGEYNSIVKDWEAVATRVCLAFPDIYDLGMSSLGMAILYDILNGLPDVLAERVYLPWVDMIGALRKAGLPLYSLESKRPLAEFDIIGFSLPYEQLFTNVLELLDLAQLPLRAAERDARHPLIIAGGHAAFNPEPMADFIDAFVIGDGEEAIVDVVRAYQAVGSRDRMQALRALAEVPGVYVPSFYDVRYHADGPVAEIRPTQPEARLPVQARVVSVLPPPPTRLLVPAIDTSHNRATIEIQRGCTRGCRFCQAGVLTRPVRERPVDEVLAAIEAIIAQTGFEEVGLLSLSSSDYSEIGRLVDAAVARFGDTHLSIALPALRADSFSIGLAKALSGSRHSGFTFAPEAASDRLRDTINKPITTEQVLEAAREVTARGWRTIKLYFMIGLPGEQLEDVAAIADVARAVREVGRRSHGGRAQVNVSVNVFVPKPHTPFQWVAMAPEASVIERQALLRREMRGRGVKLDVSGPMSALLEGVLARGDRRLGAVIARAWELGACFDAWEDQRRPGAWMQAFAAAGLDPAFYVYRERPPDEVFPWDVVSTGVRRRFLLAELERSRGASTLPDCRSGCHACGVLSAYPGAWSPEWRCPTPGSLSAEIELEAAA